MSALGGGGPKSVATLNRRLVLEAPQDVADGAGGYTRVWSAIGTLWARVDPRSGRQTEGEAGAMSSAGFTVTVRGAPVGHSSRPVAGQRFVMATRIFLIEAVTEVEPRGMYLDCRCTEEVSA
ncbi:head-tail adaptor protein [Sagittula stellata]|uniref:Head-tail adaptor, putative n=1 Tax=Sagittula stellata (strain ATCC 700073 / DSM 11524 / E-37) TaxID=388399 RepID=A3JZ45_SAGS3|nr:head-tail adaptor protein [Sagittula stellata]EBA09748.1 head-tail adaptor, putative [Sagittula stellata E-37]